jgi:hypothetical protein
LQRAGGGLGVGVVVEHHLAVDDGAGESDHGANAGEGHAQRRDGLLAGAGQGLRGGEDSDEEQPVEPGVARDQGAVAGVGLQRHACGPTAPAPLLLAVSGPRRGSARAGQNW